MEEQHLLKVNDWIKVATKGLSSSELIDFFELAVVKLWVRCNMTISDVTLTAVADRALFYSMDVHKVFLHLTINSTGIHWNEFRKSCTVLRRDEMISAFAYFIAEFISIISCITDEILAGPLHRELASITFKREKDRERESRRKI